LDNARFIGNVGWRQNEQTYDAISLVNNNLQDITFFFAYIDHVNRIFGDGDDLALNQRDFDSKSPLLNLSYSVRPFAKITGYTYLLDLSNEGGNPSSNTFGINLVGSHKFNNDKLNISYRAEYAYQQDTSDNPVDYEANYYHFKLGGAYEILDAGVGYEVLGSDDKTIGFATPLATGHAFNGWADVFLNTPPDGLEDLYVWAALKLPYDIPLKVIYHSFEAEKDGADFGNEIDAVISKKFGKNLGLLLKYANYVGKDSRFIDRNKFWAQIEFKY
jgi:hypothetical protein